MKKFHSNNDVYFIEANYDLDMQNSSNRPVFLKNRIIGDHGHLSNIQTAEYLYELVDSDKTKHVFLAHLSRDCNSSELAVNTVRNKLQTHPVGAKIEIHTEQLKRYFIKAT
jgi:phosphoribosyl 1,2-cyclic phosphodiesterase